LNKRTIGYVGLVVIGIAASCAVTRDTGPDGKPFQPLRPAQTNHVAPHAQKVAPLPEKRNLEANRGNFTFIFLDILPDGTSSVNTKADEVLKVLSKFETTHPKLEIISFQVQYKEPDNHYGNIGGVWIYHRPRK
jgi:hypothetical protein